MRITGVRLTNFGRFRGDHELDLQAGVYAIVARSPDNADRSNWLGKSTFLRAIAWALHGKFGDRSPWATLDDVISNGAGDMGVDVELSDGTFISRTKRRGQSVQLKLLVRSPSGGEIQLAQDQAQARITQLLGMGADDFTNTVWVAQKYMARLITADPAVRTGIVVDWLQMGPLEVAAQDVAQQVASTEAKLRAATLVYNTIPLVEDRAELVTDLEQAKTKLAGVRQVLTANAVLRQQHTAWAVKVDQHNAVVAVRDRIKTLEAEEPRCPTDRLMRLALDRRTRAWVEFDRVTQEHDRLVALDGGTTFDGTCPVICAACPAADHVRNSNATVLAALEHLRPQLKWLKVRHTETVRLESKLLGMHQAWVGWSRRLQLAVEQQLDLKTRTGLCGDPDELGDPPPPFEDLDLEGAVRAMSEAEAALATYDRDLARKQQAERDMAEHKRTLEIQQAALRILSRGGAQRRVATRALADIERIANAMLYRCSIGMTVSLQYGRELQKVTDVCDCGQAYPRTTTAKICARCGAIRGKKRDDKLYVVTSEVSGAAEDLAGVVIQLAAARWRRAARGAAWGVVALDEPFGACDRHNRKALSKTLAQLAQDGFEQCFCVAHSEDVLEAMPKRLIVTGDSHWSKIEVG